MAFDEGLARGSERGRFFGMIWILPCWLLLLYHGSSVRPRKSECWVLADVSKCFDSSACHCRQHWMHDIDQRLHDNTLGITTNRGSSAKRH